MKIYRLICTICLAISTLLIVACVGAQEPEPVEPCTSPAGAVELIELTDPNSDRPIRVNVYLPPCYNETDRRYPSVYLLHGGGGTHNSWVYTWEVVSLMDAMISSGEIRPMILIMPPSRDFGPEFRTLFTETLQPHIDLTYRTNPNLRAVGGASVGGGLALYMGVNHPDLFDALGIWMYGNVADLPQSLTPSLDELTPATAPAMYIRVGSNDGFLRNSVDLHDQLNERNIAHFYQVDEGGQHTVAYAKPLAPDYLRWFSQQFDELE